MDYCLGNGDGIADIFSAEPELDTDGDGVLDGIGLDFDADGRIDDAIADYDADGHADHVVLDLDDDGVAEMPYTDDGSGTWAVSVDRGGALRFFGLDGAEATGGPLVDVDGDGALDRLVDTDRDGTADRVLAGDRALADTDGDGWWDLVLTDGDGDGRADSADQSGLTLEPG